MACWPRRTKVGPAALLRPQLYQVTFSWPIICLEEPSDSTTYVISAPSRHPQKGERTTLLRKRDTYMNGWRSQNLTHPFGDEAALKSAPKTRPVVLGDDGGRKTHLALLILIISTRNPN